MPVVLNSALPIFTLILMGFIRGRFAVFDRAATDTLNRFAAYLALPSLLFVAISKLTPDQVRQLGFVGGFGGGFSLCFAVAFLIGRFRGRCVASASIEGLDAGYSNGGFIGILMRLPVLGPESAPATIIARLFTACVLFLFAVVIVDIDPHKGQSFRSSWAEVLRPRSPPLIPPFAGLALGISGLTVPAPFIGFTTRLGGDAASIGIVVALTLVLRPPVTAGRAFHVFSMPTLRSHSAVIPSALPIGSGRLTIAKLYGVEAGATFGSILSSHVFAVPTA